MTSQQYQTLLSSNQTNRTFALTTAENFSMSDEERNGCFTWCIRLKKACNQRWARVMNRLRRRLYGRRGNKVEPEAILDETGSRDIVLTKTFVATPEIISTKEADTDNDHYKEMITEQDLDRQVGDYVARILQTAVDNLTPEALLSSNKNMIKMSADDNISLTSSVISQIADIVVTESLSAVTLETDTNQSANINYVPRILSDLTVTDVLAMTADDNKVQGFLNANS